MITLSDIQDEILSATAGSKLLHHPIRALVCLLAGAFLAWVLT